MGFRFFRRLKVLPGVTLNLSRSGPSISVGPRGLKTTFGPRGKRSTVGLPGTGVSYTHTYGAQSHPRAGGIGCFGTLFFLGVLGLGGYLLAKGCSRPAPLPPPAAPRPAPEVPLKPSERMRTEGLLLSLVPKDGRTLRAFVAPAFTALSREEQVLRCGPLWEEHFGSPPGPGELLLIRSDQDRPFARFRYRDGKAEYRKLSAAAPR